MPHQRKKFTFTISSPDEFVVVIDIRSRRTFDDEQGASDDTGYDTGGHTLIDALVLLAEVEHGQVASLIHRLPCRRKRTIRLRTHTTQ